MKMIKGIIILLLLYCVSGYWFTEAIKKSTIWHTLIDDKRFVSLIGDIEDNNLTYVYKKLNGKTVFASTNDVSGSLIFKRKVSEQQLLYHITNVSATSDDLWDGRVLGTHAKINELPQRLKVVKTGSELYISTGVDQVKISEPNMEASNGVIHAIDQLLPLPDYLRK
jgi:uncharacterized surface protein with fasciclin (FAS1) repeats